MIVLDTNVLSELMRPHPDERVVAWMDGIQPSEASTTAITVAEIDAGLRPLPAGKRRARLEGIFRSLISDVADHVLPFDREAAEHYAHISHSRESLGRPIDHIDCMIAAICLARGAALATRNERDFEATGVDLVNPWSTKTG